MTLPSLEEAAEAATELKKGETMPAVGLKNGMTVRFAAPKFGRAGDAPVNQVWFSGEKVCGGERGVGRPGRTRAAAEKHSSARARGRGEMPSSMASHTWFGGWLCKLPTTR